MSEYDHDGRKYGGTMVFNPVAYNVKEATAKLRDGVLWITVRGIPGVNIKLTVVEKMLNCRITRDDVGDLLLNLVCVYVNGGLSFVFTVSTGLCVVFLF
ncbi:hypothetical protein Bca4012_062721 [Brassica carinata]